MTYIHIYSRHLSPTHALSPKPAQTPGNQGFDKSTPPPNHRRNPSDCTTAASCRHRPGSTCWEDHPDLPDTGCTERPLAGCWRGTGPPVCCLLLPQDVQDYHISAILSISATETVADEQKDGKQPACGEGMWVNTESKMQEIIKDMRTALPWVTPWSSLQRRSDFISPGTPRGIQSAAQKYTPVIITVKYTYTHICIYTQIYTYIYINICMHVYTYTCVYMWVTYKYKQIKIYHTHIYFFILRTLCSPASQ